MCDTCSGSGPRGGRRCRHHGINGSNRQGLAFRAGDTAAPETHQQERSNNMVGEALLGGFVAGVILGGAIGGILGGLGAAGAATIAGKRNREQVGAGHGSTVTADTLDTIDGGSDDVGPEEGPTAATTDGSCRCHCCYGVVGAAPFMSATVSFSTINATSLSSSSISTTTEEAMLATGRAMALGQRPTMVTTMPVLHGTRGGDGVDGDAAGGESKCSHDEYSHYVHGDHGEERQGRVRSGLRDDGGGGGLPAARLIPAPTVQAIAVPCNSRLIRTRGLTAVTATPASDSMVGVRVTLPSNNRHNSNNNCSSNARNAADSASPPPTTTQEHAPEIEATTTAATAGTTPSAAAEGIETENSFLARITRNGRRYPLPPPRPPPLHSLYGHPQLSSSEHGTSPPGTTATARDDGWHHGIGPISVDLAVALRAGAQANNANSNHGATIAAQRQLQQQQQAVEICCCERTRGGRGRRFRPWRADGNGSAAAAAAAVAVAVAADDDADADWWAGEEFEEDWGCVFDAYLCQSQEEEEQEEEGSGEGAGGGKLPCVTAREPLQGSGVSGRVARRALRIADWHENGCLERDEFALAMYLCRRHREGEGIPSRLESWMIPPRLRETRGCTPENPCPALRRRWL